MSWYAIDTCYRPDLNLCPIDITVPWLLLFYESLQWDISAVLLVFLRNMRKWVRLEDLVIFVVYPTHASSCVWVQELLYLLVSRKQMFSRTSLSKHLFRLLCHMTGWRIVCREGVNLRRLSWISKLHNCSALVMLFWDTGKNVFCMITISAICSVGSEDCVCVPMSGRSYGWDFGSVIRVFFWQWNLQTFWLNKSNVNIGWALQCLSVSSSWFKAIVSYCLGYGFPPWVCLCATTNEYIYSIACDTILMTFTVFEQHTCLV